MYNFSCSSWFIAFLVMFLVCFIGFNIARIRRDGINTSNEVIHSLPPEMGFKYKNDCNDEDSWTG